MAWTINVKGRAVKNEAPASAVMSPGHHVILDSSGELALTGATEVTGWIVSEAPERGKNIESAYAIDELTSYLATAGGDEVLLKMADAAYAIGDHIEAAAAGVFAAFSAGEHAATALEARTTTGSGRSSLLHCRIVI